MWQNSGMSESVNPKDENACWGLPLEEIERLGERLKGFVEGYQD